MKQKILCTIMSASAFLIISASAFFITLAWLRPVFGAMSSSSYQISTPTFSSGGGQSSSESFRLRGIIGLPDSGLATQSDNFAMQGGFIPLIINSHEIICYQDIDRDNYGDPGSFEVMVDSCSSGWVKNSSDCNDHNAAIHPGAFEICDGFDNNCNTFTDEEGAGECTTYYMDADGDNYGVDGNFRCLCSPNPLTHYTALCGGDSDDTNPEIIVKHVTYNLHLSSGWSIFSLPVAPIDKRKGVILPGAIVFKFSDKYELVNENANLEVGRGYWGYVQEETAYPITGAPISGYELDLPTGWSMIGSCFSQATPTVDNGTINAVFTFINKYNLLGSGHNIIFQSSGMGFWINLSEPTTLRVQ